MESLKLIQQRLESVKNISQITKAMEVVAATKMRKSQEIALSSRPYTFAALDMLATLSELKQGVSLPPLLEERPLLRRAFVIVTSDKGLAGAFNSAVIRKFSRYVKEEGIALHDSRYSFIAVGQKAQRFILRTIGEPTETFTRFGDYTTVQEIQPLSETLIHGFLEKRWDEVLVFSTNFKSALKQEVAVERLFPISFGALKEAADALAPETGRFSEFREDETFLLSRKPVSTEYLIEPSPEELLSSLAAHLVEIQIYHIMLEANASEHAARRTAMKNASENAEELGENLTLLYNKSRQAEVTQEISEIAAGAEALSNR